MNLLAYLGGWLCALALALAPAPAPASAMVVTDPTSYSYYVEQIKQGVELVEKTAKQVETMGGVLTEAQKIYSTATGHYNRAMSLVNRISRLSNAISRESTGGIFGEAKKWGNVGRQIGGIGRAAGSEIGHIGKDVDKYGRKLDDLTGSDLYVDTKEMLDEVFTDPRTIENREDRYRSLDRRYQVQQGALKEVVARAERTLGGISDRLKVVEELANMIDRTENQKDAQDLTNRILVEVLAALIDMIQIAALSNQAQALAQYQGASDAAMQQRQKRLEDLQESTSALGDVLAKKRGGSFSKYIRRAE